MDRHILKRVAEFLSRNPGHAFCDDCLAERVGLDRTIVWEAAEALSPSSEFEVDEGICSYCLKAIEDVAHVEWVKPDEDAKPHDTHDSHGKHRIKFKSG